MPDIDLDTFINQASAKYDAEAAAPAEKPAAAAPAPEKPAAAKPAAAADAVDDKTPEQAPPADPADGDDGSDTDPDDDGVGDDDAEDAESDDPELDPEFVAGAGKHIPMSLDDLPEAARPLVQKRLRDMEAGFTRALQEQRAYRKEEAAFNAEKKFLADRPVDWIVDQFQKNPTLLAQVETELGKLQEPAYAEARQMKRDAERDRAVVDAHTEQARQAQFETEVQRLDTHTFDVAKREGVPYDFVQDGIEALTHRLAKAENRLPREDELEQLITAKAQMYRRTVGAVKGNKTKDYAKMKAEQAKTAGLKGKPGAQPAPRPPAKSTAPKSSSPDDVNDFLVERLFGGESAA